MEITQIIVGGFLIQDPMTLLTDLILAVQCLGMGFILWQKGNHRIESKWIAGFLFMLGIGSLEGGIVNHGWYYLFGPGWKLPMVLIVGTSLPFLVIGNVYSIRSLVSKGAFQLLNWLVLLEYLGFLGFLSIQPIEQIDFKAMVPHLAICLILFVTLIQSYAIRKDPHQSRRLMLWAMVAILPVGIVNVMKISPDKWFNMYDLVHVLLMVPMYIIFLSGLQFAKRQAS